MLQISQMGGEESDGYERPPETSRKRKGLGLHIVYVPPSTAATMPADDDTSSDVNQTVALILGFIPLELFAGIFAFYIILAVLRWICTSTLKSDRAWLRELCVHPYTIAPAEIQW